MKKRPHIRYDGSDTADICAGPLRVDELVSWMPSPGQWLACGCGVARHVRGDKTRSTHDLKQEGEKFCG